MPFGHKDSEDVDFTKFHYELDFPDSRNVSDTAKDLIRKLLVVDPDSRLGKDSINEIQQHEYFKGVNWETVTR